MSAVSRSPIPHTTDSDETRPLLGAVHAEDGTEDTEAKPENVPPGTKLLYTLLAIAGAALLVLVIKVFLDLDDVKVCVFLDVSRPERG